MVLTDRDRALLRHLASARWLSTRQVGALLFSGVSHSMVCRRLRALRRGRFIRTAQENSMMEALHGLGAEGLRALRESGWEPKTVLERHPPANRRHFLGINDIRVAVLRSAEQDGIHLDFFFASWELAERRWPYGVVPDAVCAVAEAERSAAAIFEYDRATEGMTYLVDRKLKRYAEGLDGFPICRVITVVEDAKRRERLAAHVAQRLQDPRFSFLVRDALASWSVRELVDHGGSCEGSRGGWRA